MTRLTPIVSATLPLRGSEGRIANTRKQSLLMAAIVLMLLSIWNTRPLFAADPLDPSTLTKYVDPLPIPSVLEPVSLMGPGANHYEVTMTEFTQQLHSELAPTTVWGYNGTYPGPSFEIWKDRQITVRWKNHLPTDHLFTVDTTIHGAEPPNPYVRTVVHVHGANVPSESDGYPEAWFTPGHDALYTYPNHQQAATLWYHDHALGITSLNVYAGLAGFYLIRDRQEGRLNLPGGDYEIPIVIQDRSFYNNSELLYPHPWEPEFFGNTAVVNGKVWPYLTVEPRKYRFRFLNGSNARFYNVKLLESDSIGNIIYIGDDPIPGPALYQIGTDGGLLTTPVKFNDPGNSMSPRLLMGPAQRSDVVIDFKDYAGKFFVLHNNAKSPFKGLDSPEEDEEPLPEIMLFKVMATPVTDNSSLPSRLFPVPRIPEASAVMVRDLTLEEELDEFGDPIRLLLNGMRWDDPITETPQLGTAEIWRILNLTEDVHPIHLHLVMFQILDRQPFDVEHYESTGEIIFTGPPVPPEPNERGWKDTFHAFPGEITRIIQRFLDYPGLYVWHCHILEHEDNEMMRPYEVVLGPNTMTAGASQASPILSQNSPNPFSHETEIRFQLPKASSVRVEILNILGQKIRTLVDQPLEAGDQSIRWDGKNNRGQIVPNAVYFYRLETDDFTDIKKMILMR